MSINDQAILYRAKVLTVKSKIKNLNSIGINTKKYLEQLENIEKEVREQVEKFQTEIKKEKLYLKDLNAIYNNGIVKLELLEGRFQKYDSYQKGYNYCEYLDGKLDDEEMSEQLLDDYAKQLGNYINLINNTDTRDYAEEGKIVEKIYDTSYLIMKLEFAILGKSRIFEMAKENPVVAAFMNDCIEKDIEYLKKNGKDTKLINQSINKIRSNGMNSTYLDETLITLIALKDDNSLVNNIKDRLNSLASEIGENSSKMKEIMRRIEGIRDNINCENRNIHDGRKDNAIELLKRATAAVLVAASLFGAFVLGKKAAKVREYKTTKETFSTVMGYDSEESYEIENDDAGKTLLYVYEPYEKKGGGYRRSYIVYDVSNISSGCETIDDYLNLNLEHAAAKDKGTEQKDNSEMTEEDFNLGNETRVIKVNQDLDDCHEYTDTETRVGLTFLFSMLVIAVEGFFIWLAWDDCFFDSLEHFDNEKGKLKEYFTKFKTDLENLKRLMDSNKQLRDDFSSVYDNYKLLLDSSEMDNFSESVMIPDPQIELDRREEKLLKKVLKDKNLS